jgi:SMI1 / KNR4 family (SUKH-1)
MELRQFILRNDDPDMKSNAIKTIVDLHLKKLGDVGLHVVPIDVAPEMRAPDLDQEEEYQGWKPIESKVSDEDIVAFEALIGYPLPEDYKTFLQHKHFYELHIHEISFCSHPIHSWKSCFEDLLFNGWPREFHLDRGYIPFADWSDYASLCFDTNRGKIDHNYPIISIWFENPEQVNDEFEDFYTLLVRADAADRLRHA